MAHSGRTPGQSAWRGRRSRKALHRPAPCAAAGPRTPGPSRMGSAGVPDTPDWSSHCSSVKPAGVPGGSPKVQRAGVVPQWTLDPMSGAASQGTHRALGFTGRWAHVGAAAVTRRNRAHLAVRPDLPRHRRRGVALTHGYNSVAGVSEILSLLIAVILWPAVLFGVDLHLPPIAT